MTISRSNAVLVIVVVLAITAAAIVVQSGHVGTVSRTPVVASLADTSLAASSTSSDVVASDPAQQVPNLDQFTSRDPFIQATAAPAPATSPTPTSSPTSSPSPSPSPSPTAPPDASVHLKVRLGKRNINEIFTDCKVGDVLPPGAPLLRIKGIFADRIKFQLIDGYTLVDAHGKKIFEVGATKSTTRSIKKDTHVTACFVNVLRIGGGGTGASSGEKAPLSLTAGHSIEVLEIGANNGVPSASFEVDGAVYATEQIGQVFTTDWGQIEVLGVNAVAKTVTIQHADLQETLHLEQPVSQ